MVALALPFALAPTIAFAPAVVVLGASGFTLTLMVTFAGVTASATLVFVSVSFVMLFILTCPDLSDLIVIRPTVPPVRD
jgi:hypothetical protein